MYYAALFVLSTVFTITGPVASKTVTGKATYYNPAGGTGACGTTINNSDMEAALGSARCWATKYTITAPNGRSVTVPILDKCQACDNDPPHIDLTAGTFKALGYDLSQGVIQGVTFGPAS